MDRAFKNGRLLLMLGACAGLGWGGLIGLIFLLNVGDYPDFWFPARLVTYVLLLVAPALTFIPLERAMQARFYGYSSVGSWVIFGYVFTFLTPDPNSGREGNLGRLILLLVCLFAVLVSLFLPICHALGGKFFARSLRPMRYDLRRSFREAVLLATYFLILGGLQILGSLTWFYAVLLLLIFLVVEMLVLSRTRYR